MNARFRIPTPASVSNRRVAFRAALLALGLGAGAAFGLASQDARQVTPATAERMPAADATTVDPSRRFLDALQGTAGTREDAIRALTDAALQPSPSPRHLLHCGLAHLWAAAEGTPGDPGRHGHAVLAAHWLARAAVARPDDHRIGGWRAAAASIVATLEGDAAAIEAARTELERLAVEDPCFHAITLAPSSFGAPRDSETFGRLRTAMEASFACGMRGDIGDGRRWPHAVAGFLVALSDVRLKAGDLAGAETALVVAEARESTASWPHRALLEERIATLRERAARYATPETSDDPPLVLTGSAACRLCHAVGSPR